LAVLAGWLGWSAEQQRKLAEQQRITAEEQRTLAEQRQKTAEEQRQQADDILARAETIIINLQDRMDAKTQQVVFALLNAGAIHGSVNAMVELGKAYEKGFGVPQDFAKAREWYEKVAAQGGSSAKILLEGLPMREADRAGRYAEALRLEEALAAKVETVEIKSEGKPGKQTARTLTNLTWYALVAKEFTEALTVANRAHALFPNNLAIETNRAHALMFMGREDEAKALYLAHKGEPVSGVTNAGGAAVDILWERNIADDFAEFRKRDLTNPMMADIEKELGISR
jgi:TPR repeat protein